MQDSGKDSAAGSKPNEIEERTPSGDVMKARLQGKDAEQATSKDSEKAKDPKYEGMKRVFDKMRRRLGK
ncbi:MAG: hypothetical protein KDB07_08555 [Planctomycetes bacterium]|nr:hypothetical protein [Planctomycetota bacterium]